MIHTRISITHPNKEQVYDILDQAMRSMQKNIPCVKLSGSMIDILIDINSINVVLGKPTSEHTAYFQELGLYQYLIQLDTPTSRWLLGQIVDDLNYCRASTLRLLTGPHAAHFYIHLGDAIRCADKFAKSIYM